MNIPMQFDTKVSMEAFLEAYNKVIEKREWAIRTMLRNEAGWMEALEEIRKLKAQIKKLEEKKEELKTKLKKRKAMCETMAEYIEDRTGTCPVDQHDWVPEIDCEDKCGTVKPFKCWMLYFGEKSNK
jgi:seryl-tRNA synthetase